MIKFLELLCRYGIILRLIFNVVQNLRIYKNMSQPHYWQDALKYLSTDVVMARLIAQFPGLTLSSRGSAFETLLRTIVGQQISVIAAASIWQRLTQHIHPLTPEQVLTQDIKVLKKLGISMQKANYLHNVAHYFLDNKINQHYFKKRDFSEISADLISIKGIGVWSVEMFGIFYLLEPDIFPSKDLGLIKAIQNQYCLTPPVSTEDILKLAQQWQPYRTVATWYLWRSIDNEVVVY